MERQEAIYGDDAEHIRATQERGDTVIDEDQLAIEVLISP